MLWCCDGHGVVSVVEVRVVDWLSCVHVVVSVVDWLIAGHVDGHGVVSVGEVRVVDWLICVHDFVFDFVVIWWECSLNDCFWEFVNNNIQ